MKRAWIAGGILIALIVGCSLLSRYLFVSTDRLIAEVAALEEAVVSNSPAAQECYDTLQQSWDRVHPILIMLTGQTNCEPAETAFSSIPVWLETKREDELRTVLSQLSRHLTEIWEIQAPRVTNLF